MKKRRFRSMLKAVNNYVVFFLTVAFAVSCCMLLFVNTLSDSMGLVFNEENIGTAAKVTFVNVLLLTLLFGTIDYVRRKLMVERPVKIITQATAQIMQGDFSVRVRPMHGAGMEGFNQIGEAINAMAAELSGTETLRTDFIANVSHELKTPLAVMENYATMLQRPDITEEEKNEYAKAISGAARKLAQLITNILKLNKLENQELLVEKRSFKLNEALEEAIIVFESEIEKKELNIECDLEEITVFSSQSHLEIVWNNLISNAIKFTENGGTVKVNSRFEDGYATVEVSDTGCGIDSETGKHIFDKFYQGDTSHSGEGNGLGLALVKRVIDTLGGEISVRSEVGVGTTFTVKIK
jgi:signal transduction histidine kinase